MLCTGTQSEGRRLGDGRPCLYDVLPNVLAEVEP